MRNAGGNGPPLPPPVGTPGQAGAPNYNCLISISLAVPSAPPSSLLPLLLFVPFSRPTYLSLSVRIPKFWPIAAEHYPRSYLLLQRDLRELKCAHTHTHTTLPKVGSVGKDVVASATMEHPLLPRIHNLIISARPLCTAAYAKPLNVLLLDEAARRKDDDEMFCLDSFPPLFLRCLLVPCCWQVDRAEWDPSHHQSSSSVFLLLLLEGLIVVSDPCRFLVRIFFFPLPPPRSSGRGGSQVNERKETEKTEEDGKETD